MNKIENKIEKEIARIGLDYESAGPVSSVCVQVTGKKCRLYDDQASWEGDAQFALTRLAAIEDNAGHEAFWNIFQ